jgi:DNA repair photolyase
MTGSTIHMRDSRQITFMPRPERLLPVLGVQSDIAYIERTARSALNSPEATGMDYWSINPYIGCAFGCAYCYARYAHRYAMERAAADTTLSPELLQDMAELPPWLAFERRIFVKRNVVDTLRRALRAGSARHTGLVRGEGLLIGTATDPYQPAERRFRLTRGILEVLTEHPGLRIGIITKGPLIVRDIDLLTRIARHSRVFIHVSLITVDRALARRIEPRAPTPEARLGALARLSEAGLDVGVNVMPVLPGITDDPAALDALVQRVAATGVTHMSFGALRLQSAARLRYLPFIDDEFPDLAPRYRASYARSANVGERYRAVLHQLAERICARHGVRAADGRHDEGANAPGTGDLRADVLPADQLGLPL